MIRTVEAIVPGHSGDECQAGWVAPWAELGLTPPPGLLQALLQRYAEPHRRYHTPQHLAECLALAEADQRLAERPAELALALWFHDAVYDTRAADNESASAGWARDALMEAGATPEQAGRVHALVMATQHRAVPATPDARLLVDIDLAILSADEPRFNEYEQQVREEYHWVPEALFRAKRRAVLESFLARPRLYGTAAYGERFEARARANLRRSIVNLSAD